MPFVANFLIPLLQALFYIFMLLGVGFFAYRGFKSMFPDFKWFFKYDILKKDFEEKDVEFCMTAHAEETSILNIKKSLLVGGKTFKEVDEILYILNKIKKKMEKDYSLTEEHMKGGK